MKQSHIRYNYRNRSFTLVEVIIFIGILAIFFVTSAAIVTYSVQSMTKNEHKLIATQYAQNLMAWLRAQKESDWTTFAGYGSTTGITYCFNEDSIPLINPWTIPCAASAFGPSGSPAIYNRTATLTTDNATPTRVDVDIEVSWTETGGPVHIPLQGSFTLW